MGITIDFANEMHCDELFSLFEKTVQPLPYYNELAKKNELNKYQSDALKIKLREDPHSIIVAIENQKLLGFCFSRFDDYTIWIEWFGVSEPERRKGIAKLMIQLLEKKASQRMAHKIWCDCRTQNMKSINLLALSGYTPLCTIKNHWYKQDFILWQKEIELFHEN